MFLLPRYRWTICRAILLIAGIFVTTGTVLGFLVHPYFFAMSGMTGLMLIAFATTGFCPMAVALHRMGLVCEMQSDGKPKPF
jgi:hypothetical protein